RFHYQGRATSEGHPCHCVRVLAPARGVGDTEDERREAEGRIIHWPKNTWLPSWEEYGILRRAAARSPVLSGSDGDLLADSVPVPLAVDQGEQNLVDRRRQGQAGLWVGWSSPHALPRFTLSATTLSHTT